MAARRLLRQIACEVIDEVGLGPRDLSSDTFGGAQLLVPKCGSEVSRRVKRLRDGTLGELVACGRGFGSIQGTILYHVTQCDWGSKYDSGRVRLRLMARDAIIAEMADVLEERSEDEVLNAVQRRDFQDPHPQLGVWA